MHEVEPSSTLAADCVLDGLIEASEPYDGLFPSILDSASGTVRDELPPHIEGQRDGDRAHRGSNLVHDETTLRTMRALGGWLGRQDYTDAVERCVGHFARHCADTPSGLFPWGEHAFWHLTERRIIDSHAEVARVDSPPVGSATHDHLREVPFWLWERLWAHNRACVTRFCEGLDQHWNEGEPQEYSRHAPIDALMHQPRSAYACDFPRHGGFYIMDWAFAYEKTQRHDFL